MNTAAKGVLAVLALIGLGALVYKCLSPAAPEAINQDHELSESQVQAKPNVNSGDVDAAITKLRAAADKISGELQEENANGNSKTDVSNYDNFLGERKFGFKDEKKEIEYTPYQEVERGRVGEIDNSIEQHGNCDVLDKISKEEMGIVQIVASNTSDDYRKVSLWGGEDFPLSAPDINDVSEQRLIGSGSVMTGVHPQGVGINPVTGLIYVVNQLSNSVGIYDADGVPIKTIPLGATIPGGISPVTLAFNPVNGEAWVVGSVSNNVYVLDTHFNITHVIPSGRRPIAISYHNSNHSFYVANMMDGSIAVIDAATYVQTTILIIPATGSGRVELVSEKLTGKICVLTDGNGSLTVFASDHTMTGAVNGLGTGLLRVEGGSIEGKVFVLGRTNLLTVDITALNILINSLLPVAASGMGFNAFNGYLYILSLTANTIYAYNPATSIFNSLVLVGPNVGFVVNGVNGRFYFTGTGTSLLYIAGYSKESKWISVSDNYEEVRSNLNQVPGLVLHLKLNFSTSDKFSNLFLKHHSVSGMENRKAFSMNQYYAPQNFGNVAEVYGMQGQIINAKMSWEFFIAPHQTITFLIKILQKFPSPDYIVHPKSEKKLQRVFKPPVGR